MKEHTEDATNAWHFDEIEDELASDDFDDLPGFDDGRTPFDEILDKVAEEEERKKIQETQEVDWTSIDEAAAEQHLSEHELKWKPVDLEFWRKAPRPEIEYLFQDLIPRGVVAGLAAAGGTGKSFLVLQLCLSLATGKTLLDSFKPAKPMKVMAFLGEDPEEITQCRFHDMMSKYKFSDAEKKLLDKNLKLYPHRSEPLVKLTNDGLEKTEFYDEFQRMVDEFDPDLLVLDPKSRWAILDENNNDQATRFVSLLEELVKPFNGTVLVTHHVSKMKKSDLDASGARGASAFVDAARVFFSMARARDKDVRDLPDGRYVRVTTTKNNYGKGFSAPTLLRHDDKNGGVFDEINPDTVNLDALVECLAKELEGTDGINMSALKDPRGDFSKAIAGSLREIDRGYKKKLDTVIFSGVKEGMLTYAVETTGGKPAEKVRASA